MCSSDLSLSLSLSLSHLPLTFPSPAPPPPLPLPHAQLFGDESLYDPIQLRVWLRAAVKTQRCVWGAHTAINAAQAKPFLAWFSRAENGGFQSYDSLAITQMVRDLLVFNCEVAHDMQVRRWPAWKCVSHAGGPSHPGTPTPPLPTALQLHPDEYHQDTIDQQARTLARAPHLTPYPAPSDPYPALL